MKPISHRLCLALLAVLLLAGGGCSNSSRARRLLKAADRDFAAEKYDNAEVEYKNALRLVGLNAYAIGQMGRIYEKDGRIIDAARFLMKATEMDPSNMNFRLSLGQVYEGFHEYSNATASAIKVLTAQPTNGEALILLVTTPGPTPPLRQMVLGLPRAALNPAYHVALGMLALRERRLDEGESQLRQALAANPKSSEAYLAMAEFHSLRGEDKEAVAALQTAAAYSPWRSPIRTRYIDYLYQHNQIDEAWKVMKELTEKAPDFIPGWVSCMNLAMAQKKYDDAAKYVDNILSRDGANYDALLTRGLISMTKGDAVKGVSQLEYMQTLYAKSPQVCYQLALGYLAVHDKIKWTASLNQALALDPTYTDAALLLGQLQIRGGDPAAAVTMLNRFIKKVPNVGQIYLLLADAYQAEQQTDSALAVYQKLEQSFPDNGQIPLLLGIVEAQQHRETEARAAFEKSLTLYPDYLPAVEQLIDLDLTQAKFNDAIALAEAQISRPPKAAEPLELLAKVYVTQTNLPAAETALLKAIQVNPDLPAPYLALAQVYYRGTNYRTALQKLTTLVARTNDATAYLEIGAIHDQLKEFDAARDAYEKVLSINEKSIPALNNLAYIYAVRLKNLDRAYELAQKARALRPADPHVEDTLGWVHYEQGDYPLALDFLEDSAARSPGDAEVQYHLGLTHYMMDEEASARLALQRALVPQQDYVGKDEASNALSILLMNTAAAGASVLPALEARLKAQPGDPVLLNRIGSIQERSGDFEKAAATYETALKKNPNAAHLMVRLARLYATRLNQPDKAMSLAENAHKLAPDSAEANGILGHLVFLRGDYSWSLSLLENAADRLPDQPEVFHDLAWAYYGLGRLSDAKETMQKAVQRGLPPVDAEDAKRFLTLTDALAAPAQVQAATAEAQKVLQTDARYVPALMVSGQAQELDGNFKAAQDAYYKALKVFPQFVPAARRLAILDAAHFIDDAAGCDWAEKARSAYPDDAQVAKSLAILTYYQSKYSRSADVLRETMARTGEDGEMTYYLGMDYYQLKRSGDSKKALGRALVLKLPDKLAAEAKKTLALLK